MNDIVALSYRPIHKHHAIADLNQSETRNLAIFSADLRLTGWYHKNGSAHTDSVQFCRFWRKINSKNGCKGTHKVIDLEQFLVRISKTPTVWILFLPPSFCFPSSSTPHFFFVSLYSHLNGSLSGHRLCDVVPYAKSCYS